MVLKPPRDHVGFWAPMVVLAISLVVVAAPLLNVDVPDAHRAVAGLCAVISVALLLSGERS